MKIFKYLKHNAQVFLTAISFIALALITMPASKTGVLHTIPLLLVAPVLIVWKKLCFKPDKIDKISFVSGIGVTIYLGIAFYKRWRSLSVLNSIVAFLHIPKKTLAIIAAILLSVFAVFFLIGFFHKLRTALRELRQSHLFKRDIVCSLLMAAMVVFIGQIMLELDILSMGWFRFLWNVLLVLVSQLLIYCLIGKVQASAVLGTIIFMILPTVSRYVYEFRARCFEPNDIMSIGTAANVAGNYSLLPIPWGIVIGWALWIATVVGIFILCSQAKHKPSGKSRLKLLACCGISIVLLFVYTLYIPIYNWENQGPKYNGCSFDFISKSKNIFVSEPKGYSDEVVSALADKYNKKADSSEKQPHIIIIMDEAFSDLSVLGNLSTDKEVAPFISSLKQDTISGYALASIYGGNTANSEYELLTGNSMAWLSPNTVPYQRYVDNSTYSMVSYLKSGYGYNCIAMHPYLSSGWNRPSTYTNLGFDEILFIEDFPQKDIIRKYVSDQEMFDKIIDTYENKQDDPLFVFGVTMQNHGNYYYSGKNYKQTISLTNYKNSYSDVNQYLSVISETDKAVKNLISYFSEAEDDVVIMFFGDHQPKLSQGFYDEMSTDHKDSLEWQQKLHQVPFFIWANYDIEEKTIERTSLNYLSSYVYDVAGIALPSYNQFLREMEGTIPAINANGFYSKQSNKYLTFEQASETERKWLESYDFLQYNSIFDSKNKNKTFFAR